MTMKTRKRNRRNQNLLRGNKDLVWHGDNNNNNKIKLKKKKNREQMSSVTGQSRRVQGKGPRDRRGGSCRQSGDLKPAVMYTRRFRGPDWRPAPMETRKLGGPGWWPEQTETRRLCGPG